MAVEAIVSTAIILYYTFIKVSLALNYLEFKEFWGLGKK